MTVDPVQFTLQVLCQMDLTAHSLTAVRSLMLEWKGSGMQGDWSVKPFALHLLEEHWNGKTVEQLARETGITAERIEIRLEVATAYLQWLSEIGGTGELLSDKAQGPEKQDWKPERRAASAEEEHLSRAIRHGINRPC